MSKTATPPAPFTFERGDHLYLVSPVTIFTPGAEDIEEFAFSKELKALAPNPNILWMKGQYVEADNANENGALWTSDELAIKSLTPNFMPVTVMHDPSTAVGLIADTRLIVKSEEVARTRLENTIGIWTHRFPDVAEEALSNYSAGSLMQSMECLPTHYDCEVCGTTYPKLPGGAERAQWCVHLKGEEGAKAARILRNVCFTGTGLIFGSRGARGAFGAAHLEVLQDEVASFHEQQHKDSRTPSPKPRRNNTMEIDDKRYEELVAAESKLREIEPKLTEATELAAKVPDLERKVETLEVEKKTATDLAEEEKGKREGLEEAARADTLAKERTGKLGSDFVAKLPEALKTKLDEQAKSLSDEDWTGRLEELASLVGVKHDEGEPASTATDAPAGGKDGTFTREETARSALSGGGGGGNGSQEPAPAERRSVIANLAGIGKK